ncbi:MAG: retropepsin-like aspartic protease [bacterium]|nr:retropepsin-like aspartic protease [bacterium]
MSEHHLYNGIFNEEKISEKKGSKRPFAKDLVIEWWTDNIKKRKELGETPFLVDTGSDVTLIPQTTAQEWGFVLSENPYKIVKTASEQPIMGYIRTVTIYLDTYSAMCDLRISNQINHCILGVDFLSQFIFVYESKKSYSYSYFYKIKRAYNKS